MRPFVQGNEILINMTGSHGQIDERHLAVLAAVLQVPGQLGRQQLIEHVRIAAAAPALRGAAAGQYDPNFVALLRRWSLEAKIDEKSILAAGHIEILVITR